MLRANWRRAPRQVPLIWRAWIFNDPDASGRAAGAGLRPMKTKATTAAAAKRPLAAKMFGAQRGGGSSATGRRRFAR